MTIFETPNKHRLRRAISCVVAFVLILSHSASAIAQAAPDITPPTISPQLVDSANADVSQVFTAEAADDESLGDVSLHYRRSGESVFERVLMQPVGDTGFFTVAVDTDPEDLRSFEYYTQALDLNGNRTVSGFAFEPFVRTITEGSGATVTQVPANTPEPNTANTPEPNSDEAVVTATAPPTQEPAPQNRSNLKWLWIALGVLAAGAVVAAASGGSSGGDDDGPTGNEMNVPLTVIITDPLQ